MKVNDVGGKVNEEREEFIDCYGYCRTYMTNPKYSHARKLATRISCSA